MTRGRGRRAVTRSNELDKVLIQIGGGLDSGVLARTGRPGLAHLFDFADPALTLRHLHQLCIILKSAIGNRQSQI